MSILQNHPPSHYDKHKTYFYPKTLQLKIECNHIYDLFTLHFSHPPSTNSHSYLDRFCLQHNDCPPLFLFYTIIITLAPTPTQWEMLIVRNQSQWILALIQTLNQLHNPPNINQHSLQKNYDNNRDLTHPLNTIKKELYKFTTETQSNLEILQNKFPYLPNIMLQNKFQYLSISINKELYIHITHNPNIRSKQRKNTQKKTVPKIKKVGKIPNTKKPNYTYQNKKLLLSCGDIESNPGPKFTLLLNHPQSHLIKHKTYFYKNTTQIKTEYVYIFESFEPYLDQTQTNTRNQQLTQFCINNHHCPKNHLFYAILITLAPTPTHCNQLIGENSTQWTTNLIRKLTDNTDPLPFDPHILQKFHS
jgi:hypothetical protein